MSAGVDGCARCAELQAAYDDFQEQSRELEEGLEQELQAAQKQVETIKSKLDKVSSAGLLRVACEPWKHTRRACTAQHRGIKLARKGERRDGTTLHTVVC
jgi:ElaB/YqjD/DUF883 family membrane-anchored ribosome-binding protein